MTDKRIILHIGAPKCGSTYLQRVMLKNQALLLKAGIFYPHVNDGRTHAGNAGRIHVYVEEGRVSQHFESGASTVFLSHEDLFERPERGEILAQWASENNVQLDIIAFLRPYSQMIFGAYSQFMKEHFDRYIENREPYDGMNFEEFGRDRFRKVNVALAIRRWFDIARSGTIALYYYRQIREVMRNHIGPVAEQMDWSLDANLSNPSLKIADCDRIAAAIRDPAIDENTIRSMFRAAFENAQGDDPGKTPERIRMLEELHAVRNRIIKQDYGYDNFIDEPALRA
jgi:hypothetical protein